MCLLGSNTGIGKATALELSRRGARVMLLCRNVGKAEKVKQEIVKVLYLMLEKRLEYAVPLL